MEGQNQLEANQPRWWCEYGNEHKCWRADTDSQSLSDQPTMKNAPHKVGDHIRKAVIETIGDRQYQINFGNDQTAAVTEQQIVKE